MGLRINNNIPSAMAIRNLRLTDIRQIRNMERLSTGLRINRASDDPSGFVISEVLRGQLSSLRQAAENSTNAANLVSTAEAALNEINALLASIRESLVFALNSGSTSPEQIAAEQSAVDFAIDAIKRIAGVTRFGTLQLLNGNSSATITSYTTSGIVGVQPLSVQFNPLLTSTSYEVVVLGVASQARGLLASSPAGGALATSGGPVTLRIRGPLGTEEIHLASGATGSQLAAAINLLRGNLGIYASGGYMYTETFGSDQSISIQQIGGTGVWLQPGFLAAGNVFYSTGTDAVATIAGSPASARGNQLQVVTTFFTGTVLLNPATNQDPLNPSGGTGTYRFSIANDSGLLFQFGPNATANDQRILSLPNVAPSALGTKAVKIGGMWYGGLLPTVQSGGENDLFTNPANGLRVVDTAIAQISNARAYLGAFVAQTIEPHIRSLNVAIENLSASESSIRDLDFAEAVAEMTRNQILFQSGVSVLAQANLIPQAVLRLLQ